MFKRARTPHKEDLYSISTINHSYVPSLYSQNSKRVGTASQSSEKDNHSFGMRPEIPSPALVSQHSSNWSRKQTPSRPVPLKAKTRFGQLEGIQEEESKTHLQRPMSRRKSPSNIMSIGEVNASLDKRPRTTQNTRAQEIPLIVTNSKNRRIFSAHSKGKITVNDKRPPIETSLDQDFLALFD